MSVGCTARPADRSQRRREQSRMRATVEATASAAGSVSIDPRFVTIFNAMTAGVIVSTPDGRAVFANDAAAQLLGSSSAAAAVAVWEALIARGVGRDELGRPIGPREMPAALVAVGAASAEALLRLPALA